LRYNENKKGDNDSDNDNDEHLNSIYNLHLTYYHI